MSLEKLIEKIPPYIEVKYSDKQGLVKIGLTIRYSNSMGMWFCGYGTIRKNTQENEKKFIGSGYSVVEAVDDFISILKNK